MAHERKRHNERLFQSLLGFSPITGVFGHRQVGKSTFIASRVAEYRTLDDIDQLEQAHSDPKKFIATHAKIPMAIDECQMEPRLFPALKEWVRVKKRPGQFVLSGSVRFTSRRAIRESLAGRLAVLEMFPLSVAELAQVPLDNVIEKLCSQSHFSEDSFRHLNAAVVSRKLQKAFMAYLDHGGLPGICFIRNPALKKNALSDLHDLILGRDLKLIADVRIPLSTMKRLLSYISGLGLRPYSYAEVTRRLGVAVQTQKNLLFVLESVFLIRRIPFSKGKKEAILLEDQYEERVYAGSAPGFLDQLETAVYRNMRTQLGYRLETKDARFESYLTRDGARVPLVVHHADRPLGVIVCAETTPSLSETRSAASFLKRYANAKVLYLFRGTVRPELYDDRSMGCSIGAVL